MESSGNTNTEVNDPYVEHLRQKYLSNKTQLESARSSTFTTETKSVTFEDDCNQEAANPITFPIAPPNSSLSESERLHYLRAMDELKKAFKAGDDQLMQSLTEYEKVMQSTSAETSEYTEKSSAQNSNRQKTFASTTCNTIGKSVTLPTLPSTMLASQGAKTILTSDDNLLDSTTDTPGETETSDTMSLPIPSGPLCVADIKAIYSELAGIYKKLQHEKRRFKEKQTRFQDLEQSFTERDAELIMRETELLEHEKHLLEREKYLVEREAVLDAQKEKVDLSSKIAERLQGIEIEVQDKIQQMKMQHSSEITQLDNIFKDKSKEHKRLKSSFDAVKEQNEQLKKQVETVSDTNKKLMTQNSKLIKRLENLQRRQEFKASKSAMEKLSSTANKKLGKENEKPQSLNSSRVEKTSKQWENMFQALSISLDWITTAHLHHHVDPQPEKLPKTYLTDKCIKLLPILTDVVRCFPISQTKYYLPNLSFLYWSLYALDDTQNSLLSSTSRRLGEELFKPTAVVNYPQRDGNIGIDILIAASNGSTANTLESIVNNSQQSHSETKNLPNIYFRSSNVEVRFLSSLIILRTLHQVDVLALVFEQIKRDLKEDQNRALYIKYDATYIFLPFITYKANRALLNHAIDIFLMMAMDSVYLSQFLDMCSTETWFRSIASGIRSSKQDNDDTTVEKLSIILQKLSKNKCNRKFFDMFSLGRSLEELHRNCNPENTFLALNLRSILFNLNILKTNQAS